mgnify:CR=1 FL=1
MIDNKQVKGIVELIKPHAVIHIAANNSVPQSVVDPMPTYTDNVLQTISLLNTCVGAGVPNFIYAGSSSVYGTSVNDDGSFKEQDPTAPINPYGRTKLIAENIIKDYADVYGFNYANLRLFNVAGSNAGKNGYQKDPLVHVLPILIQAGLLEEKFTINGDNYNTPDGTCVRDYTHVNDVARAFLSVAYWMFDQNDSITFTVSGETDGGLSITTKLELDGDASGGAGGDFDSQSLTIGHDTFGTVIFSAHGGSTVMGGFDDMMPTAYEESFALTTCLLYTSPSPRDATLSRMPSSA